MARPSKPHLYRGRYWRVRVDGQTYHLGTDKRQAEAEFYRLMSARHGEPAGDRPDKVAGAVERWLRLNDGVACYQDYIRPFLEYGGRVRLADVGPDFLIEYCHHLRERKVRRNTYDRKAKGWTVKEARGRLSDKTVVSYVRAATSVLRLAVKRKWLAECPDLPQLPKPVRKARDVEPDHLVETLDDLPKRAGRILKFCAYAGCRPDEACRLEWRHVHFDAGVCILDEHKTSRRTGRPRSIFLTPEAAAVLKELRPTIGPVFVNRFGRPYKPSGLRSIIKRHGGFTTYALRHSWAQSVSEQKPIEVLARMLGHRDTKTTEFYYEVRDERCRSAARTVKLYPTKASTKTG